jgi:hypothetical protein
MRRGILESYVAEAEGESLKGGSSFVFVFLSAGANYGKPPPVLSANVLAHFGEAADESQLGHFSCLSVIVGRFGGFNDGEVDVIVKVNVFHFDSQAGCVSADIAYRQLSIMSHLSPPVGWNVLSIEVCDELGGSFMGPRDSRGPRPTVSA